MVSLQQFGWKDFG